MEAPIAVQPVPRPAITMKSLVVKRSIMIGGHKTSVSLEEAFWNGLKEIAARRNASLSELVSTIDTERELGNLSSALRLFVLGFYRDRIIEKAPGLVAPA